MNRQLTGLLAWGVLALIVGVPSVEMFFSGPVEDAGKVPVTVDARSPARDQVSFNPPVELAMRDHEVLAPEDVEIAPPLRPEPVVITPNAVPVTGLADMLSATEDQVDAPEDSGDSEPFVMPVPEPEIVAEPAIEPEIKPDSPVRVVGAPGMAVAIAKDEAEALPVEDASPEAQEEPVSEMEPKEPFEVASASNDAAPAVDELPPTDLMTPLTTEMTLLPEAADNVPGDPVADVTNAPIPLPRLVRPEPDYGIAPASEREIGLPEKTLVIASTSSEVMDENEETGAITARTAPEPMPRFLRPKVKPRSSVSYIEVNKPKTVVKRAVEPDFGTSYDGNVRFSASDLRSRRQREHIARQMFQDNPNRRFVTFNLPNGERETIYRFGGWEEERTIDTRQRLDTFDEGEFFERDMANQKQFTVFGSGWSLFASGGGSFADQLPARRGSSTRLDLIN